MRRTALYDLQMTTIQQDLPIYQGQFGEFTITEHDRTGVIIYRSGLAVAALSFAIATFLVLTQQITPLLGLSLNLLYATFAVGLGISLVTIHIYLEPLHRLLQLFWLVGTTTSIVLAVRNESPLVLFVYQHPLTLFGVGFLFAALTGIYFKEAFCFNRLETKVLTPLVPLLLLGHLSGILPVLTEQILLTVWAIFFCVFALRKVIQEIPPDIGDKSVFTYLKQQKAAKA